MREEQNKNSKTPVIATLKETKRLLEHYNFKAKRKLGQNFLVESQVIAKIISAAEISAFDHIIEIGPGLGALSQALISVKPAYLTLLELDASLVMILKELFHDQPRLNIIEADALTFDYARHAVKGYKLLANLPYYITTPLLNRLLNPKWGQSGGWRLLVLMLQKEAALRIMAKPGSKDYGPLSLAAALRAETELIAQVPASGFFPTPAVDSSIICLRRKKEPQIALKDETFFFQVIERAFAQRRKTILNNLAGLKGQEKLFWQDFLQDLGLEGGKRAEEWQLEEFINFANAACGLGAK